MTVDSFTVHLLWTIFISEENYIKVLDIGYQPMQCPVFSILVWVSFLLAFITPPLSFGYFETGSLCIAGCPGAPCVDEASFEFTEPCLCVSVLGWQVCTTIPGSRSHLDQAFLLAIFFLPSYIIFFTSLFFPFPVSISVFKENKGEENKIDILKCPVEFQVLFKLYEKLKIIFNL